MDNTLRISHCLTNALRHGKHGARGLLDKAGWAPVVCLIALPEFHELGASQEVVQNVIQMDRVKRFELKEQDGNLYIRAVQGWSGNSGVNVADALPEVRSAALPEFMFHGSTLKWQESIINEGMLCGARLQQIGGRDRLQVHWTPANALSNVHLKKEYDMVVVVRPKVLEAHGVSMFQAPPRRSREAGAVLTGSVGPRLIEQIINLSTRKMTEEWNKALWQDWEQRQTAF